MMKLAVHERLRISGAAALYRRHDAKFAAWAKGLSVIEHSDLTQVRVFELAELLVRKGVVPSASWVFEKLIAADRLTNAGMWVVVHMTYANRVLLNGQELAAADFKTTPEGHTGGSLNMVPAYVGYLAANLLSALTRSWIMGQGHCVAAIEAINTVIGNLSPEQRGRYEFSDIGLSRLVSDFYSYAIRPDGSPAAPLGSHVNGHTAGGISEGGYLGFAELQYVHMPLLGDSLVAFLSDGAFEEQRGSDWSPRWWRAEDCGPVMPIMILNGRRIEQRSAVTQDGGANWLRSHLLQNGFEPIDIDGRDPAAFAWAIIEMENRLATSATAIRNGQLSYPVAMPYAIAHTIKGYGFPGAGSNRAHNLPLDGNPAIDAAARATFNEGAKRLWVEPNIARNAIRAFGEHSAQKRPIEAEHALTTRRVREPRRPEPIWRIPGQAMTSPMDALDEYFVSLVRANPELRLRVGNPDELQSNHMGQTLRELKHRSNRPEPGVAESINGSIITALNEEAVIGAALGNKGGLNLAVSYEAFAVKMLGALRQEIIFARHLRELGRPPGWISVPLIVTSHAWENGKNELSHQDPTIGEALLGEMSDVSRVLFPADANTAVEALRSVYSGHGQIGCLVVPKRPVADVFGDVAARALISQGAALVAGDLANCTVQLVAIGAYQLREALRARDRLEERGLSACVSYVCEPGRFREPRDKMEEGFVASDDALCSLFPPGLRRVLVTHTRLEPLAGVLRRLDTSLTACRFAGFRNRGGTVDVSGMLFANRSTWAHLIQHCADLLGIQTSTLLEPPEWEAISGRGNPRTAF
ncbi:MAG: xylulose 5-phosphate 3-epimerase [Pseudorhodoplanes sp.]